jgi:regulator of RNase E activity RraA
VSAIADVLALQGLGGWLTPPLGPVVAATEPVCGTARTVQMAAGDTGPGMAPLFELLSAGLRGQVVVIAGALDVPAAVWGEILTAAAQQQGATGVLVHGSVRDRADMERLGLPVYATDQRVVGPNGRAHVVAVDQPVDIEGTVVAPGDTVVLDSTGCVHVAASIAADVLSAAARYAAGEQQVVTAIEEGTALTSAYLHKRSIVEQLRR